MRHATGPLVLKVGGELIDPGPGLVTLARAVARLARQGPLVVVHGGGREIDAELAARGLVARAVDGLRITDEATLDLVVGVLAGRANTRLVAALVAAGVPAVGLTGADAGLVRVQPLGPYRATDGTRVDLGRVGRPTDGTIGLVTALCRRGYVPVVASLGLGAAGRLFNVNADTLAAFLAARLGARRLVIAGTTPGVVDETGCTIPRLAVGEIATLVRTGRVSQGMIAKLAACRDALAAGVEEVAIVDGRGRARLDRLAGTLVVADHPRPAARLASASSRRRRHADERRGGGGAPSGDGRLAASAPPGNEGRGDR